MKPSGLGALSPSISFKTWMTSSLENTLSNDSLSSSSIQEKSNPSIDGRRISISWVEMNHLRTHLHLILIYNPIHFNIVNLISSSMEFANLWKKRVLLSPSFTNKTRDFCLQKISSKEAKYSISPQIYIRGDCSSFKRSRTSEIASSPNNSDNKLFFLKAKSPNFSLFDHL